MRHFGYLTAGQDEWLFDRPPEPFSRDSDRLTLATALGATLYSPGTTREYAQRAAALVGRGVISAVLCLEDAIRDADVADAERNVAAQVTELHRMSAPAPLLFIRVRHPDQIRLLVKELGPAASILTGFVFPKFTASNGADFLGVLAETRAETGLRLFGMPVLESPETTYSGDPGQRAARRPGPAGQAFRCRAGGQDRGDRPVRAVRAAPQQRSDRL